MVGPESERERRRPGIPRKLRLGFVALVGVSAGLITLHGGVGPLGFASAVAVGTLVGVVLVRLAFPGS